MPTPWEPAGLAVVYVCWSVFCLVWLVGLLYNARHAPPVARRGSPRSSLVSGLVVVVVLAALRAAVPPAAWQAVAYRAVWLGALGTVLLVAATVFIVWARWSLGTMWTSSAVLKVGHQLHTDGPYRVTRHPIYTGLLGMLAGTVMIGGLGLWLVIMVIGVVIAEVKLHAEERLLSEQFPEEYAEFRRRVPQLVPFLRLRG